MNTVFFLMLTASLVALTAIAPDAAFSVMLTGAGKAVETGLSLFAVYAVWLSVLEIKGFRCQRDLPRAYASSMNLDADAASAPPQPVARTLPQSCRLR